MTRATLLKTTAYAAAAAQIVLGLAYLLFGYPRSDAERRAFAEANA